MGQLLTRQATLISNMQINHEDGTCQGEVRIENLPDYSDFGIDAGHMLSVEEYQSEGVIEMCGRMADIPPRHAS